MAHHNGGEEADCGRSGLEGGADQDLEGTWKRMNGNACRFRDKGEQYTMPVIACSRMWKVSCQSFHLLILNRLPA